MSYDEIQDVPTDESSPTQDARTQFTILDIMVGVTIAAVTCGFWLQTSQPQMPMIQVVFMIPALINFVLGGTTLFSFGRRYLLKQPIDFQPGHWLLCLIGVSFIIQSIANLLRAVLFSREESIVLDDQSPMMFLILGQQLVFLVCFLVAGILMPVRPAWRLALVTPILQSVLVMLLFGSMLLQDQWYSLNDIYSYANVVINILGIFVVVVLAVWDQATTHDRRDWLHWLGVAAMLLWNLPMLILQVVNFFPF